MLVRLVDFENGKDMANPQIAVRLSVKEKEKFSKFKDLLPDDACLLDAAKSLIWLLNSDIFNDENRYNPGYEQLFPAFIESNIRPNRHTISFEKLAKADVLTIVIHLISGWRIFAPSKAEHQLVDIIIPKLGFLLQDIKKIAQMDLSSTHTEAVERYIESEYFSSPKIVQSEYLSESTFAPFLYHYKISEEEYYNLRSEVHAKGDSSLVNEAIREIILSSTTEDNETKQLHADAVMHCSKFGGAIPRFEGYFDFEYSGRRLQPYTSLEVALSYHALEEEFKKNCSWYEISSIDQFFAYLYLVCLQNGVKIKKCLSCGNFFISHRGSVTCEDNGEECKSKRKQQTKMMRKDDPIVSKANTVILCYQNRLNNLKNDKGRSGKDYALFEITLKYYQIICAYGNRIHEGNEEFSDEYMRWLERVGDLPKGHFIKLVNQNPQGLLTVHSFVPGLQKPEQHSREFQPDNGVKDLKEWLEAEHKNDPILGKKVSALIDESLERQATDVLKKFDRRIEFLKKSNDPRAKDALTFLLLVKKYYKYVFDRAIKSIKPGLTEWETQYREWLITVSGNLSKGSIKKVFSNPGGKFEVHVIIFSKKSDNPQTESLHYKLDMDGLAQFRKDLACKYREDGLVKDMINILVNEIDDKISDIISKE